MKGFGDFISGLQRDIEIPQGVNDRFEETLQKLVPGNIKKSIPWGKMAGAVAAVAIVSGAVIVSNPALASHLPFVGNVFQKVEKNVIYSGDYSKNKTLMKGMGEKTSYTVEDKDIRLTFYEVYSDGFSIFATVKIESGKYDFRNAGVTGDGRQSINLATSYGVNCDAGLYDYDLLLDGKNEGKNAFIGIVKFDKADNSAEKGVVNIAIRNIFMTLDGGEEVLVEGNWVLKIPYETDREHSREIAVGKKISDTLKIEKIFVSPYQLVIFSEMAQHRKYTNMAGFAVFDQNGNVIPFEEIGDVEGNLERDIYALQGRQVSRLHIYSTRKEKDVSKMHQAQTEEEAKKLSETDFFVNVNQ